MEEKLAEFRRRKNKERIWNQGTNFVNGIKDMFSRSPSPASDRDPLLDRTNATSPVQVLSDDEISITSIASSNISAEISWTYPSWITITTYILYSILWFTVFLIAVHLEFGYVYSVLSGLCFIYFNTRTEPKKDGEISAYSVFNPNCKAIDGTLKAEQFEKEFNLIRHDPASPVNK